MWLLEAGVREKFENAEQYRANFSAEQARFESQIVEANSGESPRIVTTDGDTVRINVEGVLTKNPDWFSYFFGGGNTTYREISSALAYADANTKVKAIDLYIDSPGGTIDGLFDTIGALQNTKKPVRAIVDHMAASAAYALASQADTIVASNKAARFGSIGVVASYYKSANVYDITSTKAPRKRPDPSTDEGQAVIREELDALHDLFVDAIGSGRGVSTKKVNDTFGGGGMYVATEALKRGMIDGVEGENTTDASTSKKAQTVSQGGHLKERQMDLETLKAQHPGVYNAAVEAGIAKERDRVAAHLTAGEMSGDMKTALEAAKLGTEMTTALQTKYLMTAANRRDQQARAEDDKEAAAALESKDEASEQDSEAKAVLALVQQKLGIGA